MIRVVLPSPLCALASVQNELTFAVSGTVTMHRVIDAIEARHPMLRGTLRDHATRQRRPFVRFFACERDLSLQPLDTPLPEAVAAGREPVLIVGAVAGG